MDFNPDTYIYDVDWIEVSRNLEQVNSDWYYTNALDDYNTINIYVTNESSSEVIETSIKSIYKSITVSGNTICPKTDGVRYVYSKIMNDDNMYDGVVFSMYYTIEYADGTIVTSSTTTIEVK